MFAPVYKGELGIDALNRALRDALNPLGKPVGGGRLRIGDKLMMTGRNLHELGLMNGTVLHLRGRDPRGGRRRGGAAAAQRRAALPAAARGGGEPAAGLRVLGAPRPGDRAAGRGHRRARAGRGVLPAPRDALHRDHAGEAGDGDSWQSSGGGSCGADAGHGSAATRGWASACSLERRGSDAGEQHEPAEHLGQRSAD